MPGLGQLIIIHGLHFVTFRSRELKVVCVSNSILIGK